MLYPRWATEAVRWHLMACMCWLRAWSTCSFVTSNAMCLLLFMFAYPCLADMHCSVNTCAEDPSNWLRCLSLSPGCIWVPPGRCE